MLETPGEVILALLRYTDWWQPNSASIVIVGSARRGRDYGDGIPSGLLTTLDERTELCRRMRTIADRDRKLLFLWYLKQLQAKDIARALSMSRRTVFRRRASAIRALVDRGSDQEVIADEPASDAA